MSCVVKESGGQRQILLQLDITSIPKSLGWAASLGGRLNPPKRVIKSNYLISILQ